MLSDKRVKSHLTSKTGSGNQNVWPQVLGKTYKNTYLYINALKDVIVDVMCKCKGKLTSEDLVKQVSKDDVKQLVLAWFFRRFVFPVTFCSSWICSMKF